MNTIKNLFNRTTRLWLYGVAIAFIPLAVFVGWLKPEAVPIVVPLVVAILNITPKDSEPEVVARSNYEAPITGPDGSVG